MAEHNSFLKDLKLPIFFQQMTYAHGNLHFYARVLQSTHQNGPEINSMLASTIVYIDKFATCTMKKAFDHSVLLLRSSGATGKEFSNMLYSIATRYQLAAGSS